jgi:hypothetical protein
MDNHDSGAARAPAESEEQAIQIAMDAIGNWIGPQRDQTFKVIRQVLKGLVSDITHLEQLKTDRMIDIAVSQTRALEAKKHKLEGELKAAGIALDPTNQGTRAATDVEVQAFARAFGDPGAPRDRINAAKKRVYDGLDKLVDEILGIHGGKAPNQP